MNKETAKLARQFHAVSYEAERELGYPYRDFISFEGMPFEYQSLILKTVERLLEKGVIQVGDTTSNL